MGSDIFLLLIGTGYPRSAIHCNPGRFPSGMAMAFRSPRLRPRQIPCQTSTSPYLLDAVQPPAVLRPSTAAPANSVSSPCSPSRGYDGDSVPSIARGHVGPMANVADEGRVFCGWGE
ncbi:hypothetical protein Mapa_006403 [Marchantia paleacea]|nr:hypothetical protein Mapa_006403 [Marchantia paleacea]